MARRQRQSDGEAIVLGLGRVLPWWACLALALVSFLVLRGVAAQMAPGNAITGPMTSALVQAGATLGQYVLSIGFIVAAIVSFIGRRQRRELVERATGSNAADTIAGMTWQQFEVLVGEGFRLQGYEVAERTQGGADGGIDLVLRRGTEKFLVQAKHWKAFKVGVEVVRELYGLMAAEGASGGFIVTSGRFTEEAKAFAEGRNVKLVDGTKLDGLLRQVPAGDQRIRARSGGVASGASRPEIDTTPRGHALLPACPACSKPMVLRTARKGTKAGSSFWGCSAFTAGCRGTRPA